MWLNISVKSYVVKILESSNFYFNCNYLCVGKISCCNFFPYGLKVMYTMNKFNEYNFLLIYLKLK